jgi:uncharacterized protein with HEPN domain
MRRFGTSNSRPRAVEHALLIITEAVKSISDELKAMEPTIQWKKIEGLGNLLRHDYQDIDPAVLWRIAHDDVPHLIAAARRMIARLAAEQLQGT